MSEKLEPALTTTQDSEDFITAGEAADISFYTTAYVTRLAQSGKIKAVRDGRTWKISEGALKDYLVEVEKTKESNREKLREERLVEKAQSTNGGDLDQGRYGVWNIKAALETGALVCCLLVSSLLVGAFLFVDSPSLQVVKGVEAVKKEFADKISLENYSRENLAALSMSGFRVADGLVGNALCSFKNLFGGSVSCGNSLRLPNTTSGALATNVASNTQPEVSEEKIVQVATTTNVTNIYRSETINNITVQSPPSQSGNLSFGNGDFVTRNEYSRQLDGLFRSIEATKASAPVQSTGEGSVTSVDLSVPPFLTVTGGPITSSGVLEVAMASGFTVPQTASTTEWSTAFGWGDHGLEGYLTEIGTSTIRNMLSVGTGLSYSSSTGAFSNAGVLSIGGLTGDIATSSLHVATATLALSLNDFDQNDYLTISAWGATTTDALSEGSDNQYFTNSRARESLSETIAGIDYTTSTGLFSLTSGYLIPLVASTTEWGIAYSWGNHASAGYLTSYTETDPVFIASDAFGIDSSDITAWDAASASTTALTPSYIRNLFSNSATGLSYNNSTGATSLAAGYIIPLTASTTEWSNKVSSQWTTAGSDIYYNTGNVGIGTTNPLGILQARAAADENLLVRGHISDTTGINIGAVNDANSAWVPIEITGSRTVLGMAGNVGIGTTNPSQKLTVQGSTRILNSDFTAGSVGTFLDTSLGASSGNTYAQFQAYTGGGVSAGNIALNPVAGNVGIGTTTPSSKLTVAGTLSASGAANLLSTLNVSATSTLATTTVTSLTATQGVTVGNTAQAIAGTIRWTGAALEAYDGGAWRGLISSDASPEPFSFTDHYC